MFVKDEVLATFTTVPGTSSHLPLESRRYEIAWGEHWTTFLGERRCTTATRSIPLHPNRKAKTKRNMR